MSEPGVGGGAYAPPDVAPAQAADTNGVASDAVRRDAAGRWMLRLHVDSQVIAVQIHAGRCGPLPELTLRAGQCGSQLHALVDLVPDAATQRESGREFCRASRVELLQRAVPSTVGGQGHYVILRRRGRRADQ